METEEFVPISEININYKTNAVDDILDYDTKYRNKKMQLANYIIALVVTALPAIPLLYYAIKEVNKEKDIDWEFVGMYIGLIVIIYFVLLGLFALLQIIILSATKPNHKFMEKISHMPRRKQLDQIRKKRSVNSVIFSVIATIFSVITFFIGLIYKGSGGKTAPNNVITYALLIGSILLLCASWLYTIIIALTKPPLSETMRDDSEEDTQAGGRRKNKTYKAKNKKYKKIYKTSI